MHDEPFPSPANKYNKKSNGEARSENEHDHHQTDRQERGENRSLHGIHHTRMIYVYHIHDITTYVHIYVSPSISLLPAVHRVGFFFFLCSFVRSFYYYYYAWFSTYSSNDVYSSNRTGAPSDCWYFSCTFFLHFAPILILGLLSCVHAGIIPVLLLLSSQSPTNLPYLVCGRPRSTYMLCA